MDTAWESTVRDSLKNLDERHSEIWGNDLMQMLEDRDNTQEYQATMELFGHDYAFKCKQGL